MGRTELLRATGQTYAAMEAAGLLLVVTRLEVRYRRPVRYDEVVEVRTRVESVSRVKIRHAYEVAVVERGGREVGPNAADDPAITAWTELACLTRDGRPTELPEFLRGPASRP
jgi:acyl-CoA thioester hydrolase